MTPSKLMDELIKELKRISNDDIVLISKIETAIQCFENEYKFLRKYIGEEELLYCRCSECKKLRKRMKDLQSAIKKGREVVG